MELIRIENLFKTYYLGEVDVPVLKGVSLSIEKGEMIALMGASGSGKSTLMNILGLLDRPTAGQYWLNGQEVSQLSADKRAQVRNRNIGFVFQSFNLLARTTAVDNVRMPLNYATTPLVEPQERERAIEVLERVGLAERMHHIPSQLSGGQQQRVAISRSLVNHPPILLADEPTGNLDSKTSVEILEMFRRLNREEGITVILVTHDMNVAKHADRIIFIKDGLIAHQPAVHSSPELIADGPSNGNGATDGVASPNGFGLPHSNGSPDSGNGHAARVEAGRAIAGCWRTGCRRSGGSWRSRCLKFRIRADGRVGSASASDGRESCRRPRAASADSAGVLASGSCRGPSRRRSSRCGEISSAPS